MLVKDKYNLAFNLGISNLIEEVDDQVMLTLIKDSSQQIK